MAKEGTRGARQPTYVTIESLTIEVENVDEIHAKAVERGVTISYPLTDEPWGVRRFFMVDPNGLTLNIMCHNAEK